MTGPSSDVAELSRLATIANSLPELSSSLRQIASIASVDPEMALTRSRKTLEWMLHRVFEIQLNESPGTRPLEGLLSRLAKDGVLPGPLHAGANFIRELGNQGTHSFRAELAREHVHQAVSHLGPIVEWFVANPQFGIKAAAATTTPTAPTSISRKKVGKVHRAIVIACVAVFIGVGGVVIWKIADRGSNDPSVPLGTEPNTLTGYLKLLEQQPDRRQEEVEITLAMVLSRAKMPKAAEDGEPFSAATDRLGLAVRSRMRGYLYVIQIDSRMEVQWLFPKNARFPDSSGTNPIAANMDIQIPHERVLVLDDAYGREELIVLFSPDRLEHLEKLLSATTSVQEESAREPDFLVRLKGNAGSERGSRVVIRDEQAVADEVEGKRYHTRSPVLLIRRWFQHNP